MHEFTTLDAAWRSQIRTLTHESRCSICLDPFTHEHQPAISDSCSHIFGASCLKEWLELVTDSTISCPTCRQHWFQITSEPANSVNSDDIAEEDDAEFEHEEDEEISESDGESMELQQEDKDEDSDDGDWEGEGGAAMNLESLRDRGTAADFLSSLYRELVYTELDAADEEIKTCVEQALLDANISASVPLSARLWENLRGMTKRMLRDCKTTTSWDDEIERNWVRRLARSLRLDLDQ